VINVIGVWRWLPKAEREANGQDLLPAQAIAAQDCLVDCDSRLRALRYGYRDKKDIARHVTRNIDVGDAGLSGHRVSYNAALFIPLAAKSFRKIRRLMAAGREEQAGPGKIRAALEYDLRKLAVRAFE